MMSALDLAYLRTARRHHSRAGRNAPDTVAEPWHFAIAARCRREISRRRELLRREMGDA